MCSAKRHPQTEPKSAVEIDADRARQGLLGRPVAVVLAGGLSLALVAWGAAEFWGKSLEPSETGSTKPTMQQ